MAGVYGAAAPSKRRLPWLVTKPRARYTYVRKSGIVMMDIILGEYGDSLGQREGVAFISDVPPMAEA